jgi:serine/threonine-protein kinase
MSGATILGRRLANRYRILREIAEGSTGTVYLAEDAATKAKVVVKLLIPDLSFDSRTLPHLRQRIQRRLKTSPADGSALSHIVDIDDVGIMSNDDLFVVMPHLQGDNLATLLRKRGILSWAQARTLVVTVGRLIAEYHREMLLEGSWPVLGTLQSSNCFCLRGRPRGESVKLVNSAVDELIIRRQWRETGTHVASLARYGAPELSTGERLDVRADVYSFGVIVYELLTAKVPFVDSNAARLEAMHLMSAVPPLREAAPDAKIPEELEAVILKALEKRPDDRFATMTAFVDALQGVNAKRLPAVRRGSGGSGRRPRPRGDTMIMASPYFDGEGEERPTEVLAAGVPGADEDDGVDGVDGVDEDDGVDELAAAMEASAEEMSGELVTSDDASGEDEVSSAERGEASAAEAARKPKVITRKLPTVASVEGKPEVVDDGYSEAEAPGASRSRSDTAPHASSGNTQVRRRPRALPSEPEAPRPPVLIRRSAVGADASTMRLGGAAAARASESQAGGQRPTEDNAATLRLPVVNEGIESSGAKPAESEPAVASSGFGEEDPEGGRSYWLWVVAVLIGVAGVLVASGGLGFIRGGDEGARSDAPAALSTSSAGARDLVHRARVAEQKGDHTEAYRLASESYQSERTVEALEVMGRSACRIGDLEMARWIHTTLPAQARPQVRALCDEAGLILGP